MLALRWQQSRKRPRDIHAGRQASAKDQTTIRQGTRLLQQSPPSPPSKNRRRATDLGSCVPALHRMMQRIKKDLALKSYSDEALRLQAASAETNKIVELFAHKIPHTGGASARGRVRRFSRTPAEALLASPCRSGGGG
jgi:hypothetical protein